MPLLFTEFLVSSATVCGCRRMIQVDPEFLAVLFKSSETMDGLVYDHGLNIVSVEELLELFQNFGLFFEFC